MSAPQPPSPEGALNVVDEQPVTLTAAEVAQLREYIQRADTLLADHDVSMVEASAPLWVLVGYLGGALARAEADQRRGDRR